MELCLFGAEPLSVLSCKPTMLVEISIEINGSELISRTRTHPYVRAVMQFRLKEDYIKRLMKNCKNDENTKEKIT